MKIEALICGSFMSIWSIIAKKFDEIVISKKFYSKYKRFIPAYFLFKNNNKKKKKLENEWIPPRVIELVFSLFNVKKLLASHQYL